MNQKAIDLSKILEMKEKQKHQKKKEQRKPIIILVKIPSLRIPVLRLKTINESITY